MQESRPSLKLVTEMSNEEVQDAVELDLIETAALGLLKRWFPTKVPTDIEKWSEIAYEDAVAALTALKEAGYQLKIERTEETNDTDSI
jgi:beta-glucosidase-like glycosyl hydrolase